MAKFTIEVEPVADDSELRRQLADALAAVEEWKATVGRWVDVRDVALTERDTARAENERLRGELAKSAKDRDCYRDQAKRFSQSVAERCAERDAARAERRACEAECELLRKENCGLRDDVDGAIAERDKARALVNDWRGRADRLEAALNEALAERDEAREAQATLNTEITTLTRDRNEALGSACSKTDIIVSLRKQLAMRPLPAGTLGAELAALRARVAELEKTLAKTEKQRDENHASAHEWRSFFDTAIEERDAARIEVITAKNKLTDARAALDRLI